MTLRDPFLIIIPLDSRSADHGAYTIIIRITARGLLCAECSSLSISEGK